MGLRKYIDGFVVVDEMCRLWGEDLEGLNLSEKIWLIRCGVGTLCDFDQAKRNGLDEDIMAAGDALIDFSNNFLASITCAFCQYLTDSDSYKPLGYYLASRTPHEQEWIDSAVEAWGDQLEDIPENDGLIFLFNTSTEIIDFDYLPNLDDMQEWLGAFESLKDEDQRRLIVAIASVTAGSYFESRH